MKKRLIFILSALILASSLFCEEVVKEETKAKRFSDFVNLNFDCILGGEFPNLQQGTYTGCYEINNYSDFSDLNNFSIDAKVGLFSFNKEKQKNNINMTFDVDTLYSSNFQNYLISFSSGIGWNYHILDYDNPLDGIYITFYPAYCIPKTARTIRISVGTIPKDYG